MQILPLKILRQEDKAEFGLNLVNLAKLQQLGMPVAQGIVISPPVEKVKKILNYLNFINPHSDYNHHQNSLEAILKISLPDELSIVAGQLGLKDVDNLWRLVLDEWNYQIKKSFHQHKRRNILTAQCVFVVYKIISSGIAYFEFQSSDTVIDIKEGKLAPKTLKQLDELVINANKKLHIPHVYHWILDEKQAIKIVKIVPQTNVGEDDVVVSSPASKKDLIASKLSRSQLKLLLENSIDYKISENIDGLVFTNPAERDFDVCVHRLLEGATSFPTYPVLYQLNLSEKEVVTKRDIDVFLFVRYKRQFSNVFPVVQGASSVDEFLETKRHLASSGITRKGSLKLYLQLNTPENLINLQDYILAGLDGVIINLDEINKHLCGQASAEPTPDKKLYQINTLIKLLTEPVKLLHKSNITIICSGKLAFDPDMLKFILDKGAYGIVVNLAESHSLHEYINFLNLKKLHFPQL